MGGLLSGRAGLGAYNRKFTVYTGQSPRWGLPLVTTVNERKA